MGRAQLDKERETQRKLEAELAALYVRAREAAIPRTQKLDAQPHPQAEELRQHAIGLAAEEPRVTIHWLELGAISTRLVGDGNAVAVPAKLAIACPPIWNVETAATVLHEVAHTRDQRNRTTLDREIFAWRWARQRALLWDDTAQRRMVESLQTYLTKAKLPDVLKVIEAEEFLSPVKYKFELVRRWKLEASKR